ncbi:uncharacterized protein ZBAI_02809 [Zygosaccharomyces bailii ISA1307]|uniref:ZYBA0S12-02982g1_1 n=1 Tax=Zygosaccharomyces bailii (strain CLIB 213 / ATCC 58445 / CBS 680 / BCRC 21525 / NBRC 1098 / NCYC 1416 / NRRL Y-2227) TaxID=1333698 RepID=A0A8J2TB32_ZYGB2|nr:ZYBA0S12-02982g1_1 [Zygosaccharomyces bailii CLIB 213]CDH11023.1 uncharacterized protein ZBAI_02809 [Zygosaccharomyces bailii ISA1307]
MSVGKSSEKQGKLDKSIVTDSKDENCTTSDINSEQEQPEEDAENNPINKQLGELAIGDKLDVRGSSKLSREEKYAIQVEADTRSIFVGNITPDVTPEIIEEHFGNCGEIKRITLLHDKHTGVPKGYAYVQFDSPEVQQKALELNGSELKGSKINVYKKRTNLPGYHKFVQYQRPNYYYPNQWAFAYNGVPDFKGLDFYTPPYTFHPDHQRNFNRFNYSYRGSYRNNYRGNRRGSYSSRGFSKNGSRFHQNNQVQEKNQLERATEAGSQSAEVSRSETALYEKPLSNTSPLLPAEELIENESTLAP